MQRHNVYSKASINFGTNSNRQLSIVSSSLPERFRLRLCLMKGRISSSIKTTHLELIKFSHKRYVRVKVADVNSEEVSDEDDDLCPVECVREFKTDDEFFRILNKAKETDSLVVVDFYRTSCGSCKYIEQGFAKLCRGSGDQEAAVIFLKHNVIDEYDEQSEVAERLRIKTVPLFHFYKNGVLLEAFPTRDKERITEAIRKYTSPASQGV
ncbi:thioredoxin-like 4, chloroplastic [Ziziphus jujuba]|uniref:Thioredoxin-like 4, chloroplastic n=1 Tax=Ziziphus jujuba TaxID=326968 RepID=A0ABM3IM63_ZIZJJ|nr:thioredoxin-like 4, chloroplastic [Ziziphus jujuba]XP_048331474.1 thioredoxin-like 4, chloroplastic [Ziziphus jujuba]